MIRLILAAALAFVFTLPARAIDIQEVTSPGGIKAWLIEEPTIPFTALEIRFSGGATLGTTITKVIIEPDDWGFGNMSINQGPCQQVPEPGPLVLLLAGLLGIAVSRRYGRAV